MKESVSVVSPIYNDRKTAPLVLPSLEKLLTESHFTNWEIVLIDDGSTDGSREWLRDYVKGKKHIRLFFHEHNQGIAKTCRDLYAHAKNDIVVSFSSDGEWDPKDVIALATSLSEKQFDIVVGVRKRKSYSAWRLIVSTLYNKVTKLFFGVDTYDAGSNKAMRKNVIESIPIISTGVFDEAERLIRAKRMGYTIGFIYIGHNPVQKIRRGIRLTHVVGAVRDMVSVWVNTVLSGRRRTLIALTAIFIGGIAFRLWIAALVPQPFINDQRDYEWYATKILSDPHGIASHTFRSYPMGLLTAIIYKFAGFANHNAVFIVQAIMDSSVAIMIFIILRRGMKLGRAAWTGAILYAVNPFTVGYVNVVLSEIFSIWTVAAVMVTGVLLIQRPSWVRGLLFGIAVGLAAEVRNAAFLWAVVPLGLLLFAVPFLKTKGTYIAVGIGLVLTVLYPLYANWRDYKAITVTTVDNMYARELFNGAIIKELPPLAPPLPQATYEMYAEYYTEYWPERQNSAYRSAMAKKYYQKAFDIIAKDPADYIKTCFHKMWFVWQKEAIYVYVEPGYESHREYTYMGNLILLTFALTGLLFFPTIKGRKGKASRWIRWTIIGSIAYGTLAFCVTHAEGRLTIPFYPLLFISAAIGIEQSLLFMKRIFGRKG